MTTLRDAGARNRVTFDLRSGVDAGLVRSPRLLLCGRPLTITGGHFWWCHGEADGVDGVRTAARRLLKEGADFIKIMASGGAAHDSWCSSYTVAELEAAVTAAHEVGKKTMAHCLGADSIARAVEAGLDQIEHLNFLHPMARGSLTSGSPSESSRATSSSVRPSRRPTASWRSWRQRETR